ncbi:hypothetical protein ACOME3_009949 [Neoechinorhynchus agilis]
MKPIAESTIDLIKSWLNRYLKQKVSEFFKDVKPNLSTVNDHGYIGISIAGRKKYEIDESTFKTAEVNGPHHLKLIHGNVGFWMTLKVEIDSPSTLYVDLHSIDLYFSLKRINSTIIPIEQSNLFNTGCSKLPRWLEKLTLKCSESAAEIVGDIYFDRLVFHFQNQVRLKFDLVDVDGAKCEICLKNVKLHANFPSLDKIYFQFDLGCMEIFHNNNTILKVELSETVFQISDGIVRLDIREMEIAFDRSNWNFFYPWTKNATGDSLIVGAKITINKLSLDVFNLIISNSSRFDVNIKLLDTTTMEIEEDTIRTNLNCPFQFRACLSSCPSETFLCLDSSNKQEIVLEANLNQQSKAWNFSMLFSNHLQTQCMINLDILKDLLKEFDETIGLHINPASKLTVERLIISSAYDIEITFRFKTSDFNNVENNLHVKIETHDSKQSQTRFQFERTVSSENILLIFDMATVGVLLPSYSNFYRNILLISRQNPESSNHIFVKRLLVSNDDATVDFTEPEDLFHYSSFGEEVITPNGSVTLCKPTLEIAIFTGMMNIGLEGLHNPYLTNKINEVINGLVKNVSQIIAIYNSTFTRVASISDVLFSWHCDRCTYFANRGFFNNESDGLCRLNDLCLLQCCILAC